MVPRDRRAVLHPLAAAAPTLPTPKMAATSVAAPRARPELWECIDTRSPMGGAQLFPYLLSFRCSRGWPSAGMHTCNRLVDRTRQGFAAALGSSSNSGVGGGVDPPLVCAICRSERPLRVLGWPVASRALLCGCHRPRRCQRTLTAYTRSQATALCVDRCPLLWDVPLPHPDLCGFGQSDE